MAVVHDEGADCQLTARLAVHPLRPQIFAASDTSGGATVGGHGHPLPHHEADIRAIRPALELRCIFGHDSASLWSLTILQVKYPL